MLNKNAILGCPKCGIYSTAEDWDTHTKEVEFIKSDAPFASAGEENLIYLKENEIFHICPICNKEVATVQLFRDKINV